MLATNNINVASQSATSGGMKSRFFKIGFIFCFTSLILYAATTINWTIIHTFISNTLVFNGNSSQNATLIKTATVKVKRPLVPPWENRRFVIFACSIHASTLAYTFYTPITAASWQRVGYQPIVVFVGDFTKADVLTPRLNLSRNYLKRLGAHIVDLQCNESYSVKLSQLVRVFSGFLPDNVVEDEDNIITGDSDLMPLKESEYKPSPNTHGFIFNSFCCGQFQRRGKSYTMYPMGHVFLQKKAWRAIVTESKQRSELLVNADKRTTELLSENAPLSFDLISLYSRHEFKEVYDQRMDKGDSAWYMDQVLCSMLLIDYREKHANFSLSLRGRADRLDRAHPMNYWDRDNFDQFGDAHLKHDEILEEHNWKIFNRLLNKLFNNTLVTLFNDYYKQYMVINTVPNQPKRR